MPEASGRNLRFWLKPGMPVGRRIRWIVGLVVAGLVIQWTISIFLGWILVFIGSLMGGVSSRSNAPKLSGAGTWENATLEELQDVLKLGREIKHWRSKTEAFRIDSGTGCIGLIAAIISLAILAVFVALLEASGSSQINLFLPPIRGGMVTPILVIDALTLFIPLWFSGFINAWEPPEIVRKAEYLLRIHNDTKRNPNLEFQPSLFTVRYEDKLIPTDCRLLVRFKDAPKDFIGIQVQISLNQVQGTKYPYCYSVIIANTGFELRRKAKQALSTMRPNKCEVELNTEKDVDVVVVRQKTKGGGYHTSIDQAKNVFESALALAETIIYER